MAVVVTGASGFIGRRLVAHLAERGVEIVAVTRKQGCRFGAAQVCVVSDYADAPARQGDVLVHLAELPQLGRAEAAGEAHVEAVAVAMRALAEKGYDRLVYASSGVVYGDRAETPRRPTDPAAAHSVYARAKLAAESVVVRHGGVVARLGNVIGPGMHEGTVVSDILDQLDADGPVIVRDVGPVRDYIWVDDVAEGLAAMALGQRAGVFNLASGCSVSVGELAKRALRLAGQPEREVVGRGPASQSHLALDIADTTAAFGWRPRTSLDEALRRLIAERSLERAAQ